MCVTGQSTPHLVLKSPHSAGSATTLHFDPRMMHSRRRLRLTQTPKRSQPTRTPSFVFLESRPVASSESVIESCESESCEMAAMIDLERIPSRDALELATLEALKSNQRTINEDGQELTPEPAPSPAKLLNVPESHHVVNFKDLSPDPEKERAPEIIRRSSGLDLPNPEPDSSSQALHRRYLLRRPTKPQLPKDMDLEDLNNSGLIKRTPSSYDQFQEVIRRAEAEAMASITAESKESGEKAKPSAEPHSKKSEPLKPPQPVKRTPSSYDQFQALIKQAEAEAMASLAEDKEKARVRRRSTRLESLRSQGSDLSDAMIHQYLLPDLYRDDSSSDERESVESKVSKRRTRQYSNISIGTNSSESENKAPKPLIVDVDPEKAVAPMLRQRGSMAIYNQSIAKRGFGTSALRRVRMNFRRGDDKVTERRQRDVARGKQFPMLRKRVNTQDSSWSQLSSSNKKKKPLAVSNQSSFDEPEAEQTIATKVLQHQLQAARQEASAAWQMVQLREKELFSMRRVLNFMERKVAQIEEDISQM
ncbi:hypothetical protein DdX_13551 [Ditylenchus destructor]|uniref:Uncharacterized protein n=1 Tax=Ditylenchus destructor TaxID=166010 RepID=A0AAD4R2S2_9BILA|nr:hypothetical protein DdX_13551 [Ditylenchus destructor]